MYELIQYLQKESNGEFTEFRLVIREDSSCYIHVMNRNSETFDFNLFDIDNISINTVKVRA